MIPRAAFAVEGRQSQEFRAVGFESVRFRLSRHPELASYQTRASHRSSNIPRPAPAVRATSSPICFRLKEPTRRKPDKPDARRGADPLTLAEAYSGPAATCHKGQPAMRGPSATGASGSPIRLRRCAADCGRRVRNAESSAAMRSRAGKECAGGGARTGEAVRISSGSSIKSAGWQEMGQISRFSPLNSGGACGGEAAM
jgi:hypothetical protein